MRVEIAVDPRDERRVQPLRRAIERREVALAPRHDLERAIEQVRVEPLRPMHLAVAAQGEDVGVLNLPEKILGLGVAEAEDRAFVILAEDVRHAELVAVDRHPLRRVAGVGIDERLVRGSHRRATRESIAITMTRMRLRMSAYSATLRSTDHWPDEGAAHGLAGEHFGDGGGQSRLSVTSRRSGARLSSRHSVASRRQISSRGSRGHLAESMPHERDAAQQKRIHRQSAHRFRRPGRTP